ncbi:hypothetical protein [Abyssogena phaseoliformis symbiont]|nr:hypothetical protein [Abyssogena phaseoliformis symbiont]MBW5289162.1 hypothetical protein [Candidatus Ruthia sp. Apha_13_S6]
MGNNNRWHKNWHKGNTHLKTIEIKFSHPAWSVIKKLVPLDE